MARVDDPLSQPTRARLFTELRELRRAASTEELAGALGLHVNGVRRHLEQLEAAGLLERRRTRHGRGRPRDEWAIAPDADPAGERPQAYTELSSWLARAIPPSPGRLRQVESTGRQIGRELAPAGAEDVATGVGDVFAALGFRPAIEPVGEAGFCCTLGSCPYRDSVPENPEVICALHRGITRGLLDELAPEARLERFEPHDPQRAGCVVEASVPTGAR